MYTVVIMKVSCKRIVGFSLQLLSSQLKGVLAFLACISTVELATQRIKPHVKKHGKLNSNTLPIKETDLFVSNIW
jgi:hypothetical protein